MQESNRVPGCSPVQSTQPCVPRDPRLSTVGSARLLDPSIRTAGVYRIKHDLRGLGTQIPEAFHQQQNPEVWPLEPVSEQDCRTRAEGETESAAYESGPGGSRGCHHLH